MKSAIEMNEARGTARFWNRVRKSISKQLGMNGSPGFSAVGCKIAQVTGWENSQHIAKGLGKKLVARYWTEVLKGSKPSERAPNRKPRNKRTSAYSMASREFYLCDAWKKLRYRALQVCGATCQCCGAKQRDGFTMHVDHVKPRFKYPELQLDLNNLQVLCSDCNVGKGAWDETDWRIDEERRQLSHLASIKTVQ